MIIFDVDKNNGKTYELAIQKQYYNKIVKPLSGLGCTFETCYKECDEWNSHCRAILIKHNGKYVGTIMPVILRRNERVA
jgi:hypothetical protein